MSKSLFNGFSQNELSLDPYDHNPEITPGVQQSIAMLQAWNETLEMFKLLRADNVGRLLVSLSPPSAPNVQQTNPAVGLAYGQVLAANLNRRYYLLYHGGTQAAYVTYLAAGVDATSILIPPGATFSDDLWTGAIFMKSATGIATSVVIWEY